MRILKIGKGGEFVRDEMNPVVERILYNIEKVIIGKRNVAELSLIALLAEGHVLLEDVPGVGKTMMVWVSEISRCRFQANSIYS